MNQAKANSSGSARNSKALIYVVDDEPRLLELAAVVLEPLGYTVKPFRDPDEALQAFNSADPKPALLITDYAMHTMTGLDLIAACRDLEPHQKVLLLSGTVDERVYRDVASKPDKFLAKPYQAKQLVGAVKSLLEN